MISQWSSPFSKILNRYIPEIDERYKVPYNFYKTFKGHLICDGKKVPISQRYFVRKNLKLKKNGGNIQSIIEKKNMVKKTPLGSGYIRAFKARDFDKLCMEELSNNPDFFLES